MTVTGDTITTEVTPLLAAAPHPVREDVHEIQSKPIPALWLRPQIITVVLLRTCEAMVTFSIQPFINQFIRDLGVAGGDDRKVGYYVGLIGSLYHATVVFTVLYWNRLSDHVGRKFVLLVGLLGSTLSIICVGLSRTYWGLVASRCLWGLLDGNLGVGKSIVGEVTEGQDRVHAFALISVVYEVGGSIGSLIGGSLEDPSQRFPDLFQNHFWRQYPYFLPCFAIASLIFGTFLYTVLFFTNPHPALAHQLAEEGVPESPDNKPVPLRQLMVYSVIISIANYASLEFLNISFYSLLPLFLAMPIDIGGVNFDPPTIGYAIGGYRAFASILLGIVAPRAVIKYGAQWTFMSAMSCYVGVFTLFPIINLFAQHFGVGAMVWTGIIAMLVLAACADMAYGSIFLIITSVSPNKRSLGTTNGLSQTTVSLTRIIAPAFATSLFSFSAERRILGGYGVHAILFTLSCFSVLLAWGLPRRM